MKKIYESWAMASAAFETHCDRAGLSRAGARIVRADGGGWHIVGESQASLRRRPKHPCAVCNTPTACEILRFPGTDDFRIVNHDQSALEAALSGTHDRIVWSRRTVEPAPGTFYCMACAPESD